MGVVRASSLPRSGSHPSILSHLSGTKTESTPVSENSHYYIMFSALHRTSIINISSPKIHTLCMLVLFTVSLVLSDSNLLAFTLVEVG